MEFLNAGPECYRKMLFACLSLSNPGQICEHDIFTLLEQFKQRDSFFFYQDLINLKDVPRDYKKVRDDSDQIFFDAFVRDVKVISHIINMRKRMMGLIDMDTSSGIENDFDSLLKETKSDPGATEQVEEDIMNQIDYIMGVINKRGGPGLYSDDSGAKVKTCPDIVFDLLMETKSVQDFRNSLCMFVAKE